MGGLRPTHEITIPTDDLHSANIDTAEEDDEGLRGGDSSCSPHNCICNALTVVIVLSAVAAIVVCVIVFTSKKNSTPSTESGKDQAPQGVSDAYANGLASKVVMVSWGTIGGGQEQANMGTGLIATYGDKVGVLTNFHVLPSEENADSYGMIHVNYTGSKMSIDQMLRCARPCGGIHLRATKSEGGFFYTGGVQASGSDWSFVGFDLDAFKQQFPSVEPYDLTNNTLANVGDDVTIWHHGAGKPRRLVHTEVWDDSGKQGTLEPQLGDPNKLEAGSSGSPIFRTSNMQLMGIFWGVVERCSPAGKDCQEMKDRFVTIDSILSQLSAQMNN